MPQNIVAGVVRVALDGVPIPVRDEASFEEFGSEGEAGVGLDLHAYFIRSPKPVIFMVTLSDLRDFDDTLLDDFDGGTITIQCDNGKLYTMNNASYIGGRKLGLTDGKYGDVKFSCSPADFIRSTWE